MKQQRDRSTIVQFEVGDQQLYEMINEYRRLQGMTWRNFILRAIAADVYRNSPQISERIVDVMTNKGKSNV